MIDFDEIINKHLITERTRNYRIRDFKVFYPSELTFLCLRSQYFKYIMPEAVVKSETLRIFKLGTMIHDWLQNIFQNEKEAFTLIDIEVPIRRYYHADGDRIHLRGRADALIELNGEEIIVEFKSMAPQVFYDYRRKKTVRDEPFRFLKEAKIEHRKQTEWYMHGLHCKTAYIIYIDKVGARTKIFNITQEKYNFKNGIVATAKKLYKHLKNKEKPPRESNHWNNKICNYCRYKETCEDA